MKIYFINIIFIIFIACNSSDNNTPNNNQNSNKTNKQSEKFGLGNNLKNVDTNTIDGKETVDGAKVPSISELWNSYKKCKAEAEIDYENGDIEKMVKNFIASADAAIELSRDDLAAWQFNNLGHYSIEEFKKRTDYQNRVRTLAIMKNQIERDAYYNETKQIFRQNYHLLKDSEPYLKKARRLDRKYKRSGRTEAIRNNLSFIQWVKEFLRK
jgi:hypothetical protein